MRSAALALFALSLSLQGALAAEGLDSEAAVPQVSESSSRHQWITSIDRRSVIGSRIFYEALERGPSSTARIAFTGDTLIHNTVTASARRQGDPFDFRPLFAPVRQLISSADLAICHLEVPLSPTSSNLSSYPLFNAPAEVAAALAWAGFDSCSTASNHSYDQGVDGVLGTLEVLGQAGLDQAGMSHRISEWWEPTLYEVGDLTVGHVAATYWLNGLRLPEDEKWLVQLLDVDEVLAVARRAKARGADLVIVSMHCCTEYRRAPTQQQIEISHRLISAPEVDLVVTHHSHVVGPVERVGDEFVLHGLGNFISGQIQSASLMDGVIAFANARNAGGTWRFESIDVVPTRVARGSYRVEIADVASQERTMAALNEMGAGIELAVMKPRKMSPEELRLLE